MPNNFVIFCPRRMPHHSVFTPPMKYISCESQCDDVIRHVTITKKTFYLTVRTGHHQFESEKRGQKPYGMGYLGMAINIMGYQNCVSYKEEHEKRLGTSFCSLSVVKLTKFCMITDMLIIIISVTTLLL